MPTSSNKSRSRPGSARKPKASPKPARGGDSRPARPKERTGFSDGKFKTVAEQAGVKGVGPEARVMARAAITRALKDVVVQACQFAEMDNLATLRPEHVSHALQNIGRQHLNHVEGVDLEDPGFAFSPLSFNFSPASRASRSPARTSAPVTPLSEGGYYDHGHEMPDYGSYGIDGDDKYESSYLQADEFVPKGSGKTVPYRKSPRSRANASTPKRTTTPKATPAKFKSGRPDSINTFNDEDLVDQTTGRPYVISRPMNIPTPRSRKSPAKAKSKSPKKSKLPLKKAPVLKTLDALLDEISVSGAPPLTLRAYEDYLEEFGIILDEEDRGDARRKIERAALERRNAERAIARRQKTQREIAEHKEIDKLIAERDARARTPARKSPAKKKSPAARVQLPPRKTLSVLIKERKAQKGAPWTFEEYEQYLSAYGMQLKGVTRNNAIRTINDAAMAWKRAQNLPKK